MLKDIFLTAGVCTSACLLPRSLRCPAASSSAFLAPGCRSSLLQISKFNLAFLNSVLYNLTLQGKSGFQPELDSVERVRYAGTDWSGRHCDRIREENASLQLKFFGLLFVLVSAFLLLVTISCSMPALNQWAFPTLHLPRETCLVTRRSDRVCGSGFASPGAPTLALVGTALCYEAVILQFSAVKRRAGPGTTVTLHVGVCQRDPGVLLTPVLTAAYRGIIEREERSGSLNTGERVVVAAGFQTAQES